ncbi:MAG: flagellar biosynthetic protein FlhB [Myxococcota bacterium]
MSDEDKQSKTFDPTPARIDKARRDGDVAKSREVSTAATILFAGIGFWLTGTHIMDALVLASRSAMRQTAAAAGDITVVFRVFATSMLEVAIATGPLIGLIVFSGTMGHLAQTGILIVPKKLAPDPSRLNLVKGLGNILGPSAALMRTAVALLKMSLVGVAVMLVLSLQLDGLHLTVVHPIEQTLGTLGKAVLQLLFAAGIALCLVAVVDFIYQRVKHKNKLKMSRDEMKRESRENDGSPEIKQKRKSMYRSLTMNRIIEEVPHADVIITNPTHYAVALRYEPGRDVAPRVVAKGVDAMALTIRKIARKHGVPIIENRPLARGLHAKVKAGHPIPADYFSAVAQVLGQVFRKNPRRNGGIR